MEGKINISLDIEEIILIKESLYDAAKKYKDFSQHPHTRIAFITPACQKADAMQKLIETLSIYGYGYRE